MSAGLVVVFVEVLLAASLASREKSIEEFVGDGERWRRGRPRLRGLSAADGSCD